MASLEEKSANQFISALVKNLQAVCHGNVEFDKNVKVVGHLFLTVDSATEFNYIVNEKVSKSDESSTTFISKSFYATDPQPKTPKENLDQLLPFPNTDDLDEIRYNTDANKKDLEKPNSSDFFVNLHRLSESRLFSSNNNRVQRSNSRRKSLDYIKFKPQEIIKRPCLSPSNTKSAEAKFSEKLSPAMTLPISIDSVSATLAHSLPGADKLESNSTSSVFNNNMDHNPVYGNGSVLPSGKMEFSVLTSSHQINHPISDHHPSPNSVVRNVLQEHSIPNNDLDTHVKEEIDLSKVKQEIVSNDSAEFGESPEFLSQLRQKSLGVYPLTVNNSESCDSLSSLSRMLRPQPTTSDKDMFDFKSGSGSNHAGIGECFVCQLCGKAFGWLQNLKRHHRVVHTNKSFNCELCGREFRRTDNLKYHMIHVHGMNLPKKLTSWFQ